MALLVHEQSIPYLLHAESVTNSDQLKLLWAIDYLCIDSNTNKDCIRVEYLEEYY